MSSPARIPRLRRRRSLAGPVILIIIGILFLLKNMGMHVPIFTIFARWWPILLIVAGLIKILEGVQAERSGEPSTRLGGGTVFLLVMLCIFGSAASAAYMHRDDINWGEVRDEIQLDDDFMHMFGNTYTYDGELQQVVSPNTSLKVISDRGGITVTAWDQPDLKVVWHKRLFASSQGQADSTNSNTNPQFSVAGSVITLNANTQAAGAKGISTDIEIYAPKKLALEISGHRGDVLVNSREGDVKVDLGRGDVTTEDVTGNVTADVRRGGIHADRVTGNLTITGRLQDVTLNEIQGYSTVSGDIFGDLHISKLAKGAKVTTSRTTVEFPKLDGEMTMDSGQLQIDQAAGPLVISTRAKDLRLDSVSGDVRVNNDAGEITLDTGDKLPLGNIEIYGRHGDVHLHLPAKAQFAINASTRHGEVTSDFEGLQVNNPDHGNSAITGRIGKGGPQITVNTDSGDVSVNGNAKEGAPATTNAETTTPAVPKPPKTPKAPAPKAAEPSDNE
jgi:DUF4097 and DUF4098 domain-containing protein YvlB